MEEALANAGYEAFAAADGAEALEILERKQVDLIVLNALLPRVDGYELLEEIRGSRMEAPILVVSEQQGLGEKRRCFRLGADDYLVKPFEEEELLLRIEALLRRARLQTQRRLRVGETELIYDSLTVREGEKETALPRKEFLLLYQLLSYPNKTFTRGQLMDEIWDLNSESDEHTVNVHISRLRDRFRENRDFSIVTVRGLGYRAVKRAG